MMYEALYCAYWIAIAPLWTFPVEVVLFRRRAVMRGVRKPALPTIIGAIAAAHAAIVAAVLLTLVVPSALERFGIDSYTAFGVTRKSEGKSLLAALCGALWLFAASWLAGFVEVVVVSRFYSDLPRKELGEEVRRVRRWSAIGRWTVVVASVLFG